MVNFDILKVSGNASIESTWPQIQKIGKTMEFLQDNIAVQIGLLVVGLALVGYFGWRSYKDRKKKSALKKGTHPKK